MSSCNELNWRTSGIHVASNSDSLKNATKATRAAFSQTFNIFRAAGVIIIIGNVGCPLAWNIQGSKVKNAAWLKKKKERKKSLKSNVLYFDLMNYFSRRWWRCEHTEEVKTWSESTSAWQRKTLQAAWGSPQSTFRLLRPNVHLSIIWLCSQYYILDQIVSEHKLTTALRHCFPAIKKIFSLWSYRTFSLQFNHFIPVIKSKIWS